MTQLKWEEDTRNLESVEGNSTCSTVGEIRCDHYFLELWKVNEWEEGVFHKYVRASGEKYFAFVKFCVPIVTGVNK